MLPRAKGPPLAGISDSLALKLLRTRQDTGLHTFDTYRKMGMAMDNIHAPSVASGERSDRDLSNGVASDKSSLMELIAEKDRVESELRALSSVLESVSCQLDSSKIASL